MTMFDFCRASRLPFVVALTMLAGCGGSGSSTNFERSGERTDILSEADRSAPSDLARHIEEGTLQGGASYEGVAAAEFIRSSDPLVAFSGTADARFVADFENQTISGRLTDWQDGSPLTHELQGEITLANGEFNRPEGELDGSFSGLVTGNLERARLAELNPETGRFDFFNPEVIIVDGVADGEFYDSQSGEAATHLSGGMTGSYSSSTELGGVMTGTFAAER